MTLAFSSGSSPVGTEAEAAMALGRNMEFLNHGLYKDVLVNEDRTTVYKVARKHVGCYVGTTPQIAAEAALSAKGITEGVKGIPPVSVYLVDETPVLAMPYYGETDVYVDYNVSSEYTAGWRKMGLADLHGGNWALAPDGTPVVIDLAGYGNMPADTSPEAQAIADAELSTEGYDDGNGCPSCDNGDDEYEYNHECTGLCPAKKHYKCCDPCQCVDLCGLRTRMAAIRHGMNAMPTCGHASRHPSRVPAKHRGWTHINVRQLLAFHVVNDNRGHYFEPGEWIA